MIRRLLDLLGVGDRDLPDREYLIARLRALGVK